MKMSFWKLDLLSDGIEEVISWHKRETFDGGALD